MKKITVLILLLLIIPLFNIRVHALPTTLLPFKVLYLDTTKVVGILDWEGSDTISWTNSTEGTASSGGFTTTTDYAFSGSYSFYWYAETYSTDESLAVTFSFTPRLHEIRLKWRTTNVNEANEIVIVTVYCDNEQVYSEETNGVNYESLWIKIDLDGCFVGYKEMKVEIQFTGVSSYRRCYVYIDAGKRFGTRLSEENLQVEYWVERIDIDTYRVHYILDESQFVTTWWVAYIEGDYYLEEGNGGRYSGLSFDGEDDYVQVSRFPYFDNSSFTIILQVKLSEWPGRLVGLLQKGYPFTKDNSLHIKMTEDTLGFDFYADALYSSYDSAVGVWRHFTFVFNNSTLKQRFYQDGMEKKARTADGCLQGTDDDALEIGRIFYRNSEALPGDISYVYIYNRSLPSDEIYDNYINEEPTNSTGLVLYLARWSIDPYAGYWYDVSGYSNHGTIYGASVSSEKALGLTLCPGSTEWKFYRDYTESSYPHSHYFVIFRFDNGTLCNSTVQINFGTSEEEVSNWLWYKEKDQIAQDIYTVKNGSDWFRHYKVLPSITAYVPDPDDTYISCTINIKAYESGWENSWVEIRDTRGRIIQYEPVSSTYQAVVYVKYLGTYTILVHKNGEVRSVGWVVFSDTELTVYIGTKYEAPSPLWKEITYSVEDDIDSNQITITLNSTEPFDCLIEIYRNETLEHSVEFTDKTYVSHTYIYTEKAYREVWITVRDRDTGEEYTMKFHSGKLEEAPTPPSEIPEIFTFVNRTFLRDIPDEIRAIGLNNLVCYIVAVLVFLVLATEVSVGIGCIGLSLVILTIKSLWGGVTAFPDLVVVIISFLGGLYQLVRK